MENPPESVIIADNQFLVIRSLSDLIRRDLHMEISCVTGTRGELEMALSSLRADLLIIDPVRLGYVSITDLQRTIVKHAATPVLVLTASLGNGELAELQSIGIRNILFKTAGEEELVHAIRMTLKGKVFHGHDVLAQLKDQRQARNGNRDQDSLTGSEIGIVKLIAEGLTTKEIATRKNVSFHTIMTHRKNIFRKLKVNNASELVMYAIRSGIIDTEYQI